MELYIKRIVHRKEFQKQKRIVISFLLFICIGLGIAVAGFQYFNFQFFLICLLFIFMAEIGYSIYLKRRRKEQQTISSDLVIVDDTNRFFYKNIIFDLHSLKQVQYSTKQTILVFEDYQLALEYDQNHIEYFKQFTDKLINIEITVKRRISLIMFILLLAVLSITLFNNIFGIIYMFMGNELIDTTGLYIDIAIIFIVIIAIALIQILKKYHLIIYTTSLIIIGIFMFLPISHIQYTDSDNYQIAYEVHTNQVDVYNDVKYHYGKKDLELEWKDIQEYIICL